MICDCCGAPLKSTTCEYCGTTYSAIDMYYKSVGAKQIKPKAPFSSMRATGPVLAWAKIRYIAQILNDTRRYETNEQ